ncbi:peptide-methionine (S)-S-oxide reductase MsrA [Rheinheimera muenzenbergensis]|uniref:Peptide methionine sulfoxide reductase MsrA n=1 Tax=Rheinheimera muenzenbergensis TaxID=1193628 RepID=A0ABU8C7J4_9GAMM
MPIQTATFGAGCFWCLEAAMNQLTGVVQALSGYMGGTANDANYRRVCDGDTGHAEVVQVEFDDSIVSYQQLCLVFFSLHDPTQLNRQGNDVGSQYRSVIFYQDAEQQKLARTLIDQLAEKQIYASAIVTQLCAAETFYPAESYHKGYFVANPQQAYCQYVVAPKLAKFRQQFTEKLKR